MSDSYDKPHGRRRRSRSLFGPILLISIGIYFLLRNLNMVPDLNWAAAARLWPLLLVFIGINILVSQVSRPFGTFLSGLVSVLTLTVFGYVLLNGINNPLLARFGVSVNEEIQRTQVEFPAQGVETADIQIEFGAAGAYVYALEDSPNLIEGDITYINEKPVFDSEVEDNEAAIELSMHEEFGWFLNPGNWATFGNEDQWEIGLSPRVVMNLDLRLGTGAADLDLSQLTVGSLAIVMGTGSLEVVLPGGDYDMTYNMGTGNTTMTLPNNGRHTIHLDGGVGGATIYVPDEMEVRIESDQGIGNFVVEGERFEQISSKEESGIWETANYGSTENQVNLIVNTGVGNVQVQPEP